MQYAATHGVEVPSVEFVYRLADGTETFMYGAAKPLFNAQGQVRGSLGVFVDITARKQAEDALAQHARDLERANEDLRQVARLAAHDLQEPLRLVRSYVQLFARHTQGQVDAMATEYVGRALDAATRLQRLMLDLLTYTEVDAQPLAFAPVDTESVFVTVLTELRGAIADRGATMTHDPLPTVWGDARQLQVVFRNLLHNGIKFHREEPPHVHLTATRDGRMWVFAVHDNGSGIESQSLERLFVPFQRLHHRDSYPKPGIGLALSRKIIERHGGRIWAESVLGVGSTVYFTLCDVTEAAGTERERNEEKTSI